MNNDFTNEIYKGMYPISYGSQFISKLEEESNLRTLIFNWKGWEPMKL